LKLGLKLELELELGLELEQEALVQSAYLALPQ
jgi:hypothetical protein